MGWSNSIVTNSNAQAAKKLDKSVIMVQNHQAVDLLDSKSRRLPAECESGGAFPCFQR